MLVKFRKSTGSGDVDQVPPNTLGYVTWSHMVAHPPDECPFRNRPEDFASIRYVRSNDGINSRVSAVPQGPLFTESANSWVPVGHDSSSRTQTIGGSLPSLVSALSVLAVRRSAVMPPPKPCVW